MKAVQSCKTCVHSVFELTPTGRVKQDMFGHCRATIDLSQPKPECMTVHVTRRCIWPTDGKQCELYSRAAK